MRTNARVYIMRAADGTLKLGHSKQPSVRAKQIGRSIEVVYQTDVIEHAERIERLAHRVLALRGGHIRGEWFEASLADAVAAIATATRQAEGEELALGGKLTKARASRSVDKNLQNLVHVRISDEMREGLRSIRKGRMDRPNMTMLIREAIADFVRQERKARAKEAAV